MRMIQNDRQRLRAVQLRGPALGEARRGLCRRRRRNQKHRPRSQPGFAFRDRRRVSAKTRPLTLPGATGTHARTHARTEGPADGPQRRPPAVYRHDERAAPDRAREVLVLGRVAHARTPPASASRGRPAPRRPPAPCSRARPDRAPSTAASCLCPRRRREARRRPPPARRARRRTRLPHRSTTAAPQHGSTAAPRQHCSTTAAPRPAGRAGQQRAARAAAARQRGGGRSVEEARHVRERVRGQREQAGRRLSL